MLKALGGFAGGSGNAAVISVNGQTGVVVLDAADVGAASNNVNIIAGTGLGGGGNLEANVTVFLANTTVTAGTYGDANNVAQIVVDSQGRITAASNVAITAVSGFATVDQAIAFAVALG